jgi:hypothetical protein
LPQALPPRSSTTARQPAGDKASGDEIALRCVSIEVALVF